MNEVESIHKDIKDSFTRWDKNNHLSNIKDSENFRYVREIVFLNSETCNAQRFISMALSQGGLQVIIKADIDEINDFWISFQEKILCIFGDAEFQIDLCYRMRIGIK